jgi:branched-chain amino acid transport system ATP-binding protein
VSLLVVKGLQVHYGGIRAVQGIDLAVSAGECVALIGANGAGKSSTLKALSGLVSVAGGTIHFDQMLLNSLPAFERARKGLVMVPEGRGIFANLRVDENMQMGAYARTDRDAVKRDTQHLLCVFPRLAERQHQLAGTLSGGEQQMLAMARALMSRPRLLLLDEPSMGLAPQMVTQIFSVIRTLIEQGITLLLVEQNARLALQISPRAYVMESGRITLAESADVLRDDPRVRQAYLGEAAN